MGNITKTLFRAAVLASLASSVMAEDSEPPNTHPFFDGAISNEDPSYNPDYIVGLHTRMPTIKTRYEENGEYYYNQYGENSFGMQEPLNVQQEMIVCAGGEQSFQHALQAMASAAAQRAAENGDIYSDYCLGESCIETVGVTTDATSMPIAKDIFDNVVANILSTSNATNNARGRFCYDMSNTSGAMNYREPQAASETYCQRGEELPLISDPVSGFTCQLTLDIPMKVGNTRFVRQAQEGAPTIGQGFIGCYTDAATGNAKVELIANPETCSFANPDACTQSCNWANEVVCNSDKMPRWGGPDGQRCAAMSTTIFKGDAITVSASPQLSYSSSDGVTYAGEATMSCAMVSGKAQWVVSGASCTPQSAP